MIINDKRNLGDIGVVREYDIQLKNTKMFSSFTLYPSPSRETIFNLIMKHSLPYPLQPGEWRMGGGGASFYNSIVLIDKPIWPSNNMDLSIIRNILAYVNMFC